MFLAAFDAAHLSLKFSSRNDAIAACGGWVAVWLSWSPSGHATHAIEGIRFRVFLGGVEALFLATSDAACLSLEFLSRNDAVAACSNGLLFGYLGHIAACYTCHRRRSVSCFSWRIGGLFLTASNDV